MPTDEQVLQIIENVAEAIVTMNEDTRCYGDIFDSVCFMAPQIVALEQSCPTHINWKELVHSSINEDLVARGLIAPEMPEWLGGSPHIEGSTEA